MHEKRNVRCANKKDIRYTEQVSMKTVRYSTLWYIKKVFFLWNKNAMQWDKTKTTDRQTETQIPRKKKKKKPKKIF